MNGRRRMMTKWRHYFFTKRISLCIFIWHRVHWGMVHASVVVPFSRVPSHFMKRSERLKQFCFFKWSGSIMYIYIIINDRGRFAWRRQYILTSPGWVWLSEGLKKNGAFAQPQSLSYLKHQLMYINWGMEYMHVRRRHKPDCIKLAKQANILGPVFTRKFSSSSSTKSSLTFCNTPNP